MAMDKFAERMDALSDEMRAIFASIDKHLGSIERLLMRWEWERKLMPRLKSRLDREYGVALLRVVSVGYGSRRFRVRANYVWETRFEDAIDKAIEEGRVAADDVHALDETDIVAWGRRRADEARLWFAVQASATIDDSDVERAAAGAESLRKVTGEDAAAVVYGRRIAAQQWDRAGELEVAVVLDEEGERE